MKTQPIPVHSIIVPDTHRKVNPKVVDDLVESIKRVGLLSPIVVQAFEGDAPDVLIAGLHRLEAAKRLDWGSIDGYCLYISDAEARMREITENLHRSELSALERAEQIEEWRVLSETGAKGGQVGSPGGDQSKQERGVKKAAKTLGVTPQAVRRAEKIARIVPAAKAAVRDAGLDDNQSKLLKIAAADPEDQVKIVHQIIEKKQKPPQSQHERQLARLYDAWIAADPAVRREFLSLINAALVAA